MRSTLTERFLDKLGAKWEYVRDYDLSRLKVSDDVTAQIRLEGTSVTHIEDFKQLGLRGESRDAPAIIVIRNGKPYDEAGDGIHRWKGFTGAGLGAHDAYVVISDDDMLAQVIRRTANIILNGKGLDDDERLRHAAYMRRQWPERSIEEIAQLFSVSSSSLSKHLRREEVRAKLVEGGITRAKVNSLALAHLDSICGHRPSIQIPLAEALTEGKLKGDEAQILAKHVKKADSEAAALRIIEEARSTYTARNKRGVTKRGALTEWKRAASLTRSQLKLLSGRVGSMTDLERRELREDAQALSVHLSEAAAHI